MNDLEHLSALVGQIYDAALDPSLWMDVLTKSTLFLGGSAAALFSKDAAATTFDVAYNYKVEPAYRQLYHDQYLKLDPCTIAQCSGAIGAPTSTVDYISYDEFLRTRFYHEWARPQRLVDVAAAVVDKSRTGAAIFGVFRHERDGLVDAETRRRMGLIAPHVRRAILVAKATEHKNVDAATLADALDALKAGVFLIDVAGRLIHANAAGRILLAQSDVLSVADGRLVAGGAQARRVLHKAVAAVGDGDLALGTAAVKLPLTDRDGKRYVAHLLPLTSGARRRAGTSHQAAAVLFVHEAALEACSAGEVIGTTYALTPTELRVLLSIVEVGGVPDCAETLGVADSTVKTHLRRVFDKTGARRQADLVRLVAGFSSPFTESLIQAGRDGG